MSMDCQIETTPRARKEHRCEECRGLIRKGESYFQLSGICEGEPYRARLCNECWPEYNRINGLAWRAYGEGVPFGAMHDDIFESRSPERICAYLKTKARRQAEIPAWMFRRLREAREERAA